MDNNKVARSKKSINTRVFSFITIVIVVFNSGYVLMIADGSNPVYSLIPITLLLVLICFAKVKKVVIKLNYYYLSFLMLLISIIITFFINIEFNDSMLYIHTIIILVMSFCISWLVERETFVNIYIKILKYITIVSLVMYFASNFLNISFNFPTISTPNASYNNGLLFFQIIGLETRNIGVFWEPGLFASFLIIGMMFEISFKETKTNFNSLLIFFLGLLTTSSTAGYLLVILVLALYISEKFNGNKRIILWMGIIFLGVILFISYDDLILFLVKSNPELFSKLIDESITSTTRTNGPLLNIDIFKQNPFFGVGFSNATEEFIRRAPLWNADSQTSTSTFYLAAIGLPGLIYTFNWIKGSLSLRDKSLLTKLTICILFLAIVNKEPHTHLVITNCIMFFLIRKNKETIV